MTAKKRETKKPKKEKIFCTYCGKKSFYLYHRNKKHEIDWAICFNCLKRMCDKILGEARDGGRIYDR